MKTVLDRFLSYIAVNSGSDRESMTVPSTKGQLEMGKILVEELREIGLSDAFLDERSGCVYASSGESGDPENAGLPCIGLISHLDTVSDPSPAGIRPRLVPDYDGGDIVLNEEKQIVLRVKDYPNLKNYVGQTMIVTDGTTILGGDDKAGVAAIISGVEKVLSANVRHVPFRICFTPDEEIGRGTHHFDYDWFKADYAYTLDGGPFGDYEFENFNSASAKITIHGHMCHIGRGKSRGLKNALDIAVKLHGMLPALENPAFVDGHDGFYHLEEINGSVSQARMAYRISDFDRTLFEKRKQLLVRIVEALNAEYGEGTVELELQDTVYNMYDVLQDKMYTVERAKRAIEKAGGKPHPRPIRGSTDGSHLTRHGLPCPNLCMGSENAHSIYEFASKEALEGVSRMVYQLLTDLTPDR